MQHCLMQVMYMTGWAPHVSQQRPSKRGSANVSFEDLADVLQQQGAVAGSSKDAEKPT